MPSRLTVLNSLGQEILSLEMEANQEQVDLTSLKPGLYILNRRSESESVQHAKVIVE